MKTQKEDVVEILQEFNEYLREDNPTGKTELVDYKKFANKIILSLTQQIRGEVENDIYRELHEVRANAGKNQLKLIAEITKRIRWVFTEKD